MPRIRGLLGYLGDATLVQGDAKADVRCVRYYAPDEPKWWGRFTAVPAGVCFSDGEALFRFPGGDDADVILSAVGDDRGRYVVVDWRDGRRRRQPHTSAGDG